jgi:hypothetical protein
LGPLVALLVLAKSPGQGNVHCDDFAIFGPMKIFFFIEFRESLKIKFEVIKINFLNKSMPLHHIGPSDCPYNNSKLNTLGGQ